MFEDLPFRYNSFILFVFFFCGLRFLIVDFCLTLVSVSLCNFHIVTPRLKYDRNVVANHINCSYLCFSELLNITGVLVLNRAFVCTFHEFSCIF